jgi:hypothetical protein
MFEETERGGGGSGLVCVAVVLSNIYHVADYWVAVAKGFGIVWLECMSTVCIVETRAG